MTSARPIPWVADKRVNWERVQALLDESAAQNHWSNFGPVSRRLEQRIAELLNVDAGFAVVATSSGTAALDAVSALEEHKRGQPPRWAVSSFGFHCTNLGPFRHAEILDCDAEAILDLAVARVIVDRFDSIVMTNVFGTVADLSPYIDFAREEDKMLVVDAAASFDSSHRRSLGQRQPLETLSFHHTKPWGFGEGGALIVPKEDASLARSVVNFGLVSNRPVASVATNAKMSDIAAAFILSWLEDIDVLREQTTEQFHRIARLAVDQGWRVLGGANRSADHGVPACVPLVAPHGVALESRDDAPLVFRKYYEPLGPTPVAHELFIRMLNVPCHPDVGVLTDGELRQSLSLT
ncbi:MAG: DegT/DnrJ/EryC1/StrS family aminotransferase [Acidimicrobiia bacterium]|nr:DegT/DnrJ/EryC1/StrS family aminotransferase [Acidimicrobiia bacterium]